MPEKSSPYSRIEHDKVSLVDLWLAVAKYQKTFWGLFAIILILGFLFVFFRPPIYTVASTIEIGSTIVDGTRRPIERLDRVENALKTELNTRILTATNEGLQGSRFNVELQQNSSLISIHNHVKIEAIKQTKSMQLELIARVKTDHKRLLEFYKAPINANISKAKAHLNWLKEEHQLKAEKAALDAKTLDTKRTLTKLTDPVFQSYISEEFRIALDLERKKIALLKGEKTLIAERLVHQKKAHRTLLHQIDELKQQINQTNDLEALSANVDDGARQTVTHLMVNSELLQNRRLLAELEGRLLYEIKNKQFDLQQQFKDNERLQAHQASTIAQLENSVEKRQIENNLEIERQLSEIAKIKAILTETDSRHQQQITNKKIELVKLQAQLDTTTNTRTISAPQRSNMHTNASATAIVLLSAMLGALAGIAGILVQTIIVKSRTPQQTI